ncbi:TPA: type-1Aa cytolytic delta-endotoxin [Bacillus cereus]|nr:type-1Aa cytolytic delta-endotoxin [Bacillus cereus]
MKNFNQLPILNNTPLENNPFTTQSTTREIVLRVTEPTTTSNMKQIFEIEDENALLQAIFTANAFNQALIPIESDGYKSLYFDVELALKVVETLNPPGAIFGSINQILTQKENTVETMIEKVTDVFLTQLNLTLSTDSLNSIRAALTNTFTNLDAQKTDAWIFYQQNDAFKSSYTYNILFSFINEKTGTSMITIPIGFYIQAESKSKKILWVTYDDKVSYEVHIQALKVIQPLINTSATLLNTISRLV